MNEGLYFIEVFTESYARRFKIDRLFFRGKSQHQLVHCFYNRFLGKVLFLDKKIQSAQIDEFIYHESLVQPTLLTHPGPRKVLVIGGGEGATIREVLRHKTIEKVVMVDIDKMLVEICRTHMPEWSEGAFDDPRTTLIFDDARRYVEGTEDHFDVIISDLTEPVEKGPSVYLFTKEFFRIIHQALGPDGIFVLQAGSVDPNYNHFFCSCWKTLERLFPVVRPYWSFVLSFGLPWGFILASKQKDPLKLSEAEIDRRLQVRAVKNLRYYHSGLHRSPFSLPLYIQKSRSKARVLRDASPFIWEL